jgi:hypothetical protein
MAKRTLFSPLLIHLSFDASIVGTYFGQFEGSNSRAACEGVTTQVNTVPVSHVNSRIKSPIQPTTAGVRRHMPGAGSITHHYGIYAETVDTVSAGVSFNDLSLLLVVPSGLRGISHCYSSLVAMIPVRDYHRLRRLGIRFR